MNLQVHQENKSNEASESSSTRNILKPADTSSFNVYASQLKMKPYPEPRGPLASEVVLGGSLPDTKPPVQKKAEEEEEPLQGKGNIQFAREEEEEPIQGKGNIQLTEEEEEPLQGKFKDNPTNTHQQDAAPNKTGMPDNLKNGIENLSGMDLGDVKVHYNSDKPAQLQAHAYAKGTNIYVGSGQEHNLPHEAWHVVQQKQGRVQPTMQMKEGVSVNDDNGLEREADLMGNNALNTHTAQPKKELINQSAPIMQARSLSNVAQLVTDAELAVANIGTLTAAQAGEITAIQAGALSQQQFAALPANRLGDLTIAAFAALSDTDCIAHITQAQAVEITAAQAGVMTQQQFAALPGAQLADLINAAFAALSDTNCIAHITQAQAGAVTAGQAGAMTQQQFAALPAARLADLIDAAFAALRGAVCIANMTQAQAGAITAGQAAVMTVQQLSAGIGLLQYMGANSRRIQVLRLKDAVKAYILANQWAPPPGYSGTDHSPYYNFNRKLPGRHGYRHPPPYYEYDIYPYVGLNRGGKRIVTNGHNFYYTLNHYNAFTHF
jgi:guanyl-specific ribonuclease Sa